MPQYIGYFRVSTAEQGRSGLGLEAQTSAVDAYLAHTGGTLLDTYTEVESGGDNARPELAKALKRARLTNGTLLVAKLDRLSRSVAFISTLMESSVKFRAADMPEANELTLHLMAAMAQHERKMISERTRAALAAAKARGVVLGNPRLEAVRNADTAAANTARTRLADQFAHDMAEVIEEIPGSLQHRANVLNERGFRTRRGKAWTAAAVRNVLRRAGHERA